MVKIVNPPPHWQSRILPSFFIVNPAKEEFLVFQLAHNVSRVHVAVKEAGRVPRSDETSQRKRQSSLLIQVHRVAGFPIVEEMVEGKEISHFLEYQNAVVHDSARFLFNESYRGRRVEFRLLQFFFLVE
jgi:hypothetical protein